MNDHTHHYGVTQGQPIPRFRSALTKTRVRFIKWQEKRLEANCTKVWWHRNRLGEVFLYGKFCHDRDWTPVTLAYYHPGVGFVTMRRDIIEFRLAHHPGMNIMDIHD
jgi:hypothetical protein